jgi:hypothetical protein
MLARHKETYIRGLTLFRDGDVDSWLAIFADAAASAAQLAQRCWTALTIAGRVRQEQGMGSA